MRPLTMGSWIGAILVLARVWPSLAYITYLEARYPLQGVPSPRGSVWPEPRSSWSSKLQRVLTAGSFRITSSGAQCDVLANGTARYAKLIFFNAMASDGSVNRAPRNETPLDRLHVTVSLLGPKHCRYPRFGDDESYKLNIPPEGDALLNSTTVWGALRGLETFSQLVYQDTDSKLFLVNETKIEDWPRFQYRGLLVDCVTRFLPVKTLKRNLDAMAYNKFNVFHWFLGDATAWRLQLAAYPNLTKFTRLPRHMYRQQDVREVIEHARMRGIRVIPEIAISQPPKLFLDAFPGMVTMCRENGSKEPEPVCPSGWEWDVADLSHALTYEIYSTVFKELAGLFRDEYMHLGTRRQYQGDSEDDLAAKFERCVKKFLKIPRKLGFKLMVWRDGLNVSKKSKCRWCTRVPRETIVQLWNRESRDYRPGVRDLALAGHRMVFSDSWNLSAFKYGPDWKQFYTRGPGQSAAGQAKDLIIGGEATLWSHIVDATNLIPRVWPRASAIAERLWSNNSIDEARTNDAAFRLDEQRCRMLNRGIKAQPILNGFCGDQDLDYDGHHYPEDD
ncbi:beta-hexosaminidase subunit alpha-like [Haemaphysalis longicornis]